MKVYNWERITKRYVGCNEANESPLEPGVFLIPAYATNVPIPDDNIDDNQRFFWNENENKWEAKIFEETKDADDIIEYTAEQYLRMIRNGLLGEVDWVVIKQYSLGLPVSEEISNYMQQLRDLPAISNPVNNSDGLLDMNSVNWPKKPDIILKHVSSNFV